MFAKFLHTFLKYTVICNYLHLNASGSGLPLLSCLLNIQQSPHCFDSLNKKWLNYTLNTLHPTLHNTLTTHFKPAKCHNFLNSQNSLSLLLSVTITVAVTLLPPSLPQLPPVPQQPNHVVCHIILWLVGVVLSSTNRKGGVTSCFFCLLANTSCLQTLSWEKPIVIVSSCTKRVATVTAMCLTEAWSPCYVILDWSRDFDAPVRQLTSWCPISRFSIAFTLQPCCCLNNPPSQVASFCTSYHC